MAHHDHFPAPTASSQNAILGFAAYTILALLFVLVL